MDNTEELTHISVCAGYGGIDLGLKRVLPTLRTVALCEVEAYACANLVAKMEAGLMDAAPIWSNLKTFPWSDFRDRVGILSGGYPCQPFSAAGKRLGTSDERHLWPFIADGVRLLRPRICFFENVEGHITLGLSTVISDLEELGYEVSWGIFSAAEVGAPHQRKRVFIMAVSRSIGGQTGIPRSVAWNEGLTGVADHGCSQDLWPSRPGEPQHAWEPPRVVANTEFIGRRGRSDGDARGLCGETQTARPCDSGAEPSGSCPESVVDSESKRSGGGQELCETHGRQERTLSREPHQSGEILGDTSLFDGSGQAGGQRQTQAWRASAEWDNRQAEPKVGGGVDGAADWLDYVELCVSSDNRTDELRMLGNGVCVPTAAKAFVTLMEELL